VTYAVPPVRPGQHQSSAGNSLRRLDTAILYCCATALLSPPYRIRRISPGSLQAQTLNMDSSPQRTPRAFEGIKNSKPEAFKMSARKLTFLSVVLLCATWVVAQHAGGSGSAGGSTTGGSASQPGQTTPSTPPTGSTAQPPTAGTGQPPTGSSAQPPTGNTGAPPNGFCDALP
jgi:hypothetical protein